MRSNLNPADYETKFPAWAGLLVGFVVGLLMVSYGGVGCLLFGGDMRWRCGRWCVLGLLPDLRGRLVEEGEEGRSVGGGGEEMWVWWIDRRRMRLWSDHLRRILRWCSLVVRGCRVWSSF